MCAGFNAPRLVCRQRDHPQRPHSDRGTRPQSVRLAAASLSRATRVSAWRSRRRQWRRHHQRRRPSWDDDLPTRRCSTWRRRRQRRAAVCRTTTSSLHLVHRARRCPAAPRTSVVDLAQAAMLSYRRYVSWDPSTPLSRSAATWVVSLIRRPAMVFLTL